METITLEKRVLDDDGGELEKSSKKFLKRGSLVESSAQQLWE